MEIKYSDFKLDIDTFGQNELVGLVDHNSNFIYNRIYDIRVLPINENIKVDKFLKPDKSKKKPILSDMLASLEIGEELLKKKLRDLSSGEYTKVLTIKHCLLSTEVVILEHIDTCINARDLESLCLVIKKHLDELHKTIILSTTKVDNIINNCTRYIFAEDERITYNGSLLEKIPIKTQIQEFVDMANKKKAKLIYYKEESDLLKAIYRSVKK